MLFQAIREVLRKNQLLRIFDLLNGPPSNLGYSFATMELVYLRPQNLRVLCDEEEGLRLRNVAACKDKVRMASPQSRQLDCCRTQFLGRFPTCGLLCGFSRF